jgi:catechol 2,3-dioxygenase-like lactoylglutathione lyase family enzyme
MLATVDAPVSTATANRFHIGLNVSNLARSVAFYRRLFGQEPAKFLSDYAKFEIASPPMVLALYPSPQSPGGALNHVGLRLPDSAALVEVQRRLEEAGISTQRQEGVECCYARQTKFWVTDPDRTLWEIYTLHEDIDHSGFDDPPAPVLDVPPEAVWEHRLTDHLPERIPYDEGALDEIRLEGSFNANLTNEQLSNLLLESFRALRSGGRIAVHGLVSDKPFPGAPKLPGLASMVQRVPVETEALDMLQTAGFIGMYFEKLGDIHCFSVNGVELREMRLLGWKQTNSSDTVTVMYKGPFAELLDDDGTCFRRAEPTLISPEHADRLRHGPAADQFSFLPK